MRRSSATIGLVAVILPACDIFLPSTGYLGQDCGEDETCANELVCDHGTCSKFLGVGESCETSADCRIPLTCNDDDTCQPSGSLGLGAECAVSRDCLESLYCAAGQCADAGEVVAGEECSSSADCVSGLHCISQDGAVTCRVGGEGYLGDPCASREECMAGLFCDPAFRTCVVSLAAPAGDACEDNDDCLPMKGYYCSPCDEDLPGFCDAETDDQVCRGSQPDGQPVPTWRWGECPAENSTEFKLIFEVASAGTPGAADDFFRLPFPNDIRSTGGNISLTGFPVPPTSEVSSDGLSRVINAIEAEHEGFGPRQTVFMRTTKPPLFCESGCGATDSCAQGCMGSGEAAPSIYVVDLTEGIFPGYLWTASTGVKPYLCGPWIAIGPGSISMWEPGHTYAAFLHNRVLSKDLEPQTQDVDFAAMLAPTDPGGALGVAWQRYAPLRDWLASGPPYKTRCRTLCTVDGECNTGNGETCRNGICGDGACEGQCTGGDVCAGATCETPCPGGSECTGDETCTDGFCVRGSVCPSCATGDICTGSTDVVEASHLGGGTVFTIRDPTAAVTSLGDVIEGLIVPPAHGLASCAGASPPAECAAPDASYVEIQGEIDLPCFQAGIAPYEDAGGEIVTSVGVPQVQTTQGVRFSLTIPSQATPAGGWPVVVYAHGTGGDFQSHITEGLAGDFAEAGLAMLGIDQILHGTRSDATSEALGRLVLNLDNPEAARGNALQAAADQLSLLRAINNLSLEVTALAGMGDDDLDPSRVSLLGHDQGAAAVVLAKARDTTGAPVVLSGVGGGIVDILTGRTSPADSSEAIAAVIGKENVGSAWIHPALNLIQTFLDDVDPVNLGRYVSAAPLGGPRCDLLMIVGTGDTFVPNSAALSLARQITQQFHYDSSFNLRSGEGIYVDDGGTGFASPVAIPPVSGNFHDGDGSRDLTIAVTVHEPMSLDGHFVLFDIPKARERAVEFFATWAEDPGAPPTVIP